MTQASYTDLGARCSACFLDPMTPIRLLFPASLLLLGYASLSGQGTRPKSPEVNFGRDVRPRLSEHCFKCHGPDAAKAAAGLRLDSFSGATAHLADGSAIVPHNPRASLLIDRVSDPDPLMRMPPQGAGVSSLSPAQIDVLRNWISQGAKYEKHWAFVAPKMPSIPTVRETQWPKNPIDRFVLSKLEAAGLKPEPEADRDTLALRAAQTLTGLPPTLEELNAFRHDNQPGAYERYVDRLMSKPSYGENQARYWLDAVRYGDTHGLQLDNERAVYPYRDWVIRSFNSDLPFNKFAQWQIAGDLLPNPSTEQLIATGYVRMNLTSNEGGAIPEEFLARNTFDRVDTTSTVFLGLTVGCAKCHDHKYDPIKQKDYYGLYAYFDSTQDEPLDGNIALPPPFIRATTPEVEARLTLMDRRLRSDLEAIDVDKATKWFEANRQPPLVSHDWQKSEVSSFATFDEAFDNPGPAEPGQVGKPAWKPLAFQLGKDFPNLIGKDNSFVYVKGTFTLPKERSETLQVGSDDAIKLWLNGKLVHSHKITRGLADGFDTVKVEFRAGDNELIAKVINAGEPDGFRLAAGQPGDAEVDKALAALRRSPKDQTARRELQRAFLEYGPETDQAGAYRKLEMDRTTLEQSAPMTLIAREMPKPRPTFILKRGLYDQKGPAVVRHIPSALGSLPASLPNDRLGLATWLIDPSNPLVSRVFVNRVWQQNFGTGIVKTVEDFGSQGEWPLNQPLLDYLSVSFIQNGWSVKKLNRMIVTSAAFRQSSRISPQKLAKDPENRLISRGPRFRLDAEVIRDKALKGGGLLVERIGGHGFKGYQPDGLWEGSSDPASSTHFYVRDRGSDIYRRSLYLFWKRTSPPPVMVTFDAALRDTCIVRRSTTNTPLQALAVLNEPSFLESCRTMAARVLTTSGSDAKRLQTAFELTLGRPPHPPEATLLLRAVTRYRGTYQKDEVAAQRLLNVGDSPQTKSAPIADQAAWMIVCSSLMNTDEFLTQH